MTSNSPITASKVGDKQVARSYDFIDFRQSFNAVRQSGNRLSAADAVDFFNSQLAANRQHVAVIRPVWRGRGDYGDFLYPCALGGDGCHEDAGRVRRRAAGYADPNSIERQVPFHQIAVGTFDADVFVQNRRLEFDDVLTNFTDGVQKLRFDAVARLVEFFLRDAKLFRRHAFAVDSFRVFQNGVQTPGVNVAANLLDNLLRRKRLAENLDRPLTSRFRNDVPAGGERLAKLSHKLRRLTVLAADVFDVHFNP